MFNREIKLTKEEQQYENIVVKLLNHKETKIYLKVELGGETKCLLKNEEKHFKVLIDSVGITIQNTTFSTKNRLKDKVINKLVNLALKKNNEQTENELKEMSEKEERLLDNINSVLN